MKNNKIFMLGVVGLSAVLLSGCLKKEGVVSDKPLDEKKVAEAMEKGKPVYCIMDTSEGGTVETWTKGEKTKVYGTNMGGGKGMGYMISDEEWTYMWVDGSTKGSKYPVTDEETPRSEGEEYEGEMADFDMKQELADHQVEEFKYDCKEQNISDSMFVPPTNVEFEDVMKKFEKMGADLEGMGTDFEGMGNSLEDFKR